MFEEKDENENNADDDEVTPYYKEAFNSFDSKSSGRINTSVSCVGWFQIIKPENVNCLAFN